jgi:hypothetical protein
MKSYYQKYLELPTYIKIIAFIALLSTFPLFPEKYLGFPTLILLVFICERIYQLLKFIFGKVFKKYTTKQKALTEYQEKVKAFLLDNNLSEKEKSELEDFKKLHNLTDKDVAKYNVESFQNFFKKISDDSRISEEERNEMVKIYKDLNLPTDNIVYNQNEFNKYYMLDQVEKGVLPVVQHDLNINLKPGEKLHYAYKASIIKNRTVTDRINYGGFTASVRIMKGVSYRVGSIKTSSVKRNVLEVDDVGYIYLTSENLGYMGTSKHFSIPYTKITSLDMRGGYLYIFKQGKEVPFIISMNDYEVLLAITSFKINS